MAFQGQLTAGMTKDEVRGIFNAGNFEKLTLVDSDPAEWEVVTPFVVGASNWVLYLSFADSVIAQSRVRTMDYKGGGPPEGAPADRVFPAEQDR